MTSFVLEPFAALGRRVARAWHEGSLLSLSDRYVALASDYAVVARDRNAAVAATRTLARRLEIFFSIAEKANAESEEMALALLEIAQLPKTVKVANGTTRKAARIAREALA